VTERVVWPRVRRFVSLNSAHLTCSQGKASTSLLVLVLLLLPPAPHPGVAAWRSPSRALPALSRPPGGTVPRPHRTRVKKAGRRLSDVDDGGGGGGGGGGGSSGGGGGSGYDRSAGGVRRGNDATSARLSIGSGGGGGGHYLPLCRAAPRLAGFYGRAAAPRRSADACPSRSAPDSRKPAPDPSPARRMTPRRHV
jgi:hypothetical protein